MFRKEEDNSYEQTFRLTMALDIVHELIGIITEEGVIEKMFILFSKLFAPKSLFFKCLNPAKLNIYKFPRNIEIDEKFKSISIDGLDNSPLKYLAS